MKDVLLLLNIISRGILSADAVLSEGKEAGMFFLGAGHVDGSTKLWSSLFTPEVVAAVMTGLRRCAEGGSNVSALAKIQQNLAAL